MAVGDLKARLRARFPRRHSITPASTTAESDTAKSRSISKSLRSLTLRSSIQSSADLDPSQLGAKGEEQASQLELPEPLIVEASSAELQSNNPQQQQRPPVTSITVDSLSSSKRTSQFASIESALPENEAVTIQGIDHPVLENIGILEKLDLTSTSSSNTRTSHTQAIPTPGSLFSSQNSGPIETAESIDDRSGLRSAESDYFPSFVSVTGLRNMGTRKIWVKRPHASATLVTVNEEDLVDDVREMILRKYANSLGRNFDAPDLTLRIVLRDARQERTLGPDELMCRTLDAAFPGGQGVDDALLIDVPSRRTPRASPRGGPPAGYYHDEGRPGESGSDYFPPMPIPIAPTPHLPNNVPVSSLIATSPGHHPASNSHAISVLTTGHVPNLPSPGGSRRHHARPRAVRQHTPSPTLIGGHIPSTAVLNNEKNLPPLISPIPTPPAAQEMTQLQRSASPPPRVSSPRVNNRPKRNKKNTDHPSLPAGLLSGGVPPINVLIVEDNIINLKLLEAFMKRLKVRWQTAMNGKEAVTKWRAGGFHLVLMDIQLPVMNGLEATREIRRLEKLNSIGVFSSSASSSAPDVGKEPEGDDKLPNSILFKSPVIIVALTASSLQSDRHEALAAGCNDFLTKPVNFVWLERKVMEWGCMQALIDFDGWRKWKDFSQNTLDNDAAKKMTVVAKAKPKKNRMSLGGGLGLNGLVGKGLKPDL